MFFCLLCVKTVKGKKFFDPFKRCWLSECSACGDHVACTPPLSVSAKNRKLERAGQTAFFFEPLKK
jgi:hypothetical protein